jgi:hypothetical protein
VVVFLRALVIVCGFFVVLGLLVLWLLVSKSLGSSAEASSSSN